MHERWGDGYSWAGVSDEIGAEIQRLHGEFGVQVTGGSQMGHRDHQRPKENAKLSDKEIELGASLIENMSDGFNPEKYRDKYRERVQAILDEKSKGQEITIVAPEAPRHGQLIDLMQALKQSIEKAKPKQKVAPAQRKRKTGSSDS